ncbi:hypothetical protein [Microbacterium halophytorum]|uniref:hypothetical protein n=1 Tax=Microbacterium halophytorum TaxID=2067568 RepID=UPI000CFD28E5|nr:hypothetical protein [Microbacterium halophytorum]
MASLDSFSRQRIERLLLSTWPTLPDEADALLSSAADRWTDGSSEGIVISPVAINLYEGRVCAFSWFATYPDSTRLIEAHDELADVISGLLGAAVFQERGDDHSEYWVTPRFAIETYAHDVSGRADSGGLVPTLQVNVADAALAALQEADARRSV